MALFEPHGCTDVEGVDMLPRMLWRDGSPARVHELGRQRCVGWAMGGMLVPTDVIRPTKQYPFLCGAAAVAMLVGADAPLALEGARTQALINEWDFYKPIGLVVDGAD